MDIYGKSAALVFLLLLSGFFSSSETAFFSLRRIRLRKRGKGWLKDLERS
jgi:CBS domain containing-hemolysin-like protein